MRLALKYCCSMPVQLNGSCEHQFSKTILAPQLGSLGVNVKYIAQELIFRLAYIPYSNMLTVT